MSMHAKVNSTWLPVCAIAIATAVLLPQKKILAQEVAAGDQLEEVVVTARRREEKLIDVPLSVQYFSGTELSESGITDLTTLSGSAGYSFQAQASNGPGGRYNPSLSFRGLQSFYNNPEQNSGSLFVDGIFVSGGQASVSTVDIDHVEVLKGPQSTFFGRNTFGGAINFITLPPSNDLQEKVDVSYSGRGSSNVTGTVEGPIVSDTLDARLSLSSYMKAAEYTASDGGPLGAERSLSLDSSFLLKPIDKLNVRLNIHYQEDNDSQPALGFLSPGALHDGTCSGRTFHGQNAAGQSVAFQLNTAYYCGSVPTLGQVGAGVINANTAFDPGFAPIVEGNITSTGPNAFFKDVPHLDHTGLESDHVRVALLADYSLPYNMTASFTTGYNSTKTMVAHDVDFSSEPYFDAAYPTEFEDLTVDARVVTDPNARLRGLLGLDYSRSIYETQESALYGVASGFGGFSFPTSYTNNHSSIPAVYGSLDLDIFKSLTASFEARYQEETDRALQLAPTPHYSVKDDAFLPRVILRFKPIEQLTSYLSFAKGVEPIDINNGFLSAPASVRAQIAAANPNNNFSGQPKLESLEAGIKQQLFSNRLEYTLDVFDMLWSGDQIASTVFYGTPPTAYTVDTPENARIKGGEFTSLGLITPHWSAGLDFSYTDATWVHYSNSFLTGFTSLAGTTLTLNGNKVARVPEETGALHTTYTLPLNTTWSAYARADATYTGSMYESDLNTAKTNDFFRVNARLGFKKDNLSVELYAINLLNDKNWDWASRTTDLINFGAFNNLGLLVQAPPRQDFGVRLVGHF